MLLRHRTWSEPPASEITPRTVYLERRSLLRAAAGACALPALAHARTAGAAALRDAGEGSRAQADAADRAKASGAERAHDGLRTVPSEYSTMERPTPYGDVTGYNNFYEFGTDKDDPARYADRMRIRPWSVSVEGEVARPRSFDVEELMKLAPLEERIYRMRCVEGWSMVIPWVGYPFSELMKRVEPTGNAKYVEFTTLADPKQMPGLRSPVLEWPYVEGLRIDEAANALTLLGVGVYGEALPKQNGAPVRVVVPWKYGFKSAKSLVKIRFVERQPLTAWQRAAPREYGFYSNVNPEVDHPRWSQATERRIGEGGLFARKRPTRMFNGYADQVASLYAGMDLRKEY